ncbi:hypothetical protein [Streptomyces sp. ID05-47C]|nr:hypothetical protein [Streptomyces sp. ID05-47C]MDX3569043.1 hypothetical protein [Streptomyces sp. ID05-47C]
MGSFLGPQRKLGIDVRHLTGGRLELAGIEAGQDPVRRRLRRTGQ